MSHILTFAPEHIEPIQNGEKRLTIRLNRPDGIRKGDQLKFVDASNNEIFGHGIAVDVYETTVAEILGTGWEYHDNYRNIHRFNQEFEKYYNKRFDYGDIFDVIEWGEMFHPNKISSKT